MFEGWRNLGFFGTKLGSITSVVIDLTLNRVVIPSVTKSIGKVLYQTKSGLDNLNSTIFRKSDASNFTPVTAIQPDTFQLLIAIELVN